MYIYNSLHVHLCTRIFNLIFSSTDPAPDCDVEIVVSADGAGKATRQLIVAVAKIRVHLIEDNGLFETNVRSTGARSRKTNVRRRDVN